MRLDEAVRSVLTQYATFGGRARRSELWWFVLFSFLLGLVAQAVDAVLGTNNGNGNGLVSALVSLALLVPSLAVASRRLHDTDRSGWWLLLILIPLVGAIFLIVWFCQDSRPDNRFGPSPKAPAAGGRPV